MPSGCVEGYCCRGSSVLIFSCVLIDNSFFSEQKAHDDEAMDTKPDGVTKAKDSKDSKDAKVAKEAKDAKDAKDADKMDVDKDSKEAKKVCLCGAGLVLFGIPFLS